MSAFGGRRAPNVSQYVANLNTIPSAHDVATQQQEGFSLEDDLAMFTNTEFFDFDLGENTLAAPLEYDPLQEERARRENAAAQQKNLKGVDFLNGMPLSVITSAYICSHLLLGCPLLWHHSESSIVVLTIFLLLLLRPELPPSCFR